MALILDADVEVVGELRGPGEGHIDDARRGQQRVDNPRSSRLRGQTGNCFADPGIVAGLGRPEYLHWPVATECVQKELEVVRDMVRMQMGDKRSTARLLASSPTA